MRSSKTIHDEEWQAGWKSCASPFVGEERFRQICHIAASLKPRIIFDLGCGNGYQADMLKRSFPGVLIKGCDISSSAIEKASKILDFAYVWDIDNDNLPENEESFDLVICSAVLEHFYDTQHAIEEICRILKKGKHAIIQVPNLSFWRFRLEVLFGKIPYILRDERHLHCFNKNFLIEKLSKSGLICQRVFGHRVRFKKLANWSPCLFSEDILVLAVKE